MPQALVRALELPLERRVAHARPGDRRAPNVGAGTELARLRPYLPGDDVRHLDAAATARTGDPHVRLHVPERALTTWVVLDVSPSMAFGTARPAEGRRRRGRRARARPPGGLPRRRVGARALRRGRPADPAAADSSRRALVGLGLALQEGVARDGRARPARPRARARADRGRRPPAGSGGDRVGLPRPAGLVTRARGAADAPLGARGRDRTTRARASCPRSGSSPWSIPRRGPARARHVQPARPRALRRARVRAARDAGARAAASSGRARAPLDRRGLAARAREGAAVSLSSPIWLATLVAVLLATLAYVASDRAATRYAAAFPRSTRCARPPARAAAGARTFLRDDAASPSRRSPSRSPARRSRRASPRGGPRSCSSPTTPARCRRPTSTPRG